MIILAIMNLYWNIGFNKKFIGYAIYTSIPIDLSLVTAVLLIMISKGKFELLLLW